MKTRYIPALFLSLTLFGATAQTDNKKSLQRAVTIEKEFTPIVQDASKINSIPEMEVSASERPDIKYTEWKNAREETPSVTILPAGDNGVEAPDRQRGYARIEIGNYLNINANAGVRIIDKTRDQLFFWYQHNSTNGTLSYLRYNNSVNTGDDETKQRRNDNKLNLKYTHIFDNFSWQTSAYYRYNGFNYYGKPLYKSKKDIFGLTSTTDQQTVQHYGIDTKIVSKPNKSINYTAEINYKGYNSDLGLFYGQRGVLENHLTTRIDGNAPINEFYNIGIAVSMDNLIYNRCDKENYTILRANPYFGIEKEKIRFKAGLLVDLSFNDNTIFRIAPDLRFEWEFDKLCFLYAQLTGGKSINSWEKMSTLTSYINPTSSMANTYTPADFTVGLRTTTFKKLHFTLYGGIKYSVDALFDYRQQIIDVTGSTGRLTRPVISFYATDAYAWKAGFEIQYAPRDFLKAHLAWEHNEWHRKGGKERILSSQPRNEWKAGVTVIPIRPLDITADFYMADGLGYRNRVEGNINYPETGNLPNIVTLNLGAVYRLNKQIHFSAQLNNLLSKRTDLFYGMPAQRFHFLVGAGVVF